MKNNISRGIATLPTVLVLGIMTLAVVVGITSVSLTESFISQGSTQSSKALFYAESGARDALVKIARNKNYTYTSGEGYLIDFSTNGCSLSNDCAKVLVSAGVGTIGDPKIVTSKGIMKAGTRTIRVSVIIDTNGQIATSTAETVWTEITN